MCIPLVKVSLAELQERSSPLLPGPVETCSGNECCRSVKFCTIFVGEFKQQCHTNGAVTASPTPANANMHMTPRRLLNGALNPQTCTVIVQLHHHLANLIRSFEREICNLGVSIVALCPGAGNPLTSFFWIKVLRSPTIYQSV